MNPSITPEFIILITIIFLLLLYIFRQYRIIADLKNDIDFKDYSNMAKYKFLLDKNLGNEYYNWLDSYTKNRIKEIEPSE